MTSFANTNDTFGEYHRNQPKDVSLKAADTSPPRYFQPLKSAYQLPRELPGIDLENALARVGGNRELFVKLLTDFYRKYKNTGQTLSTLAAKYRSQNDDDVRTEILMLIHTIKGISGNLGATELCSASLKLERAFKNDPAVPKEQSADIEFVLNKFLEAMASVWEAVQILHKQAD
jgi:HPt (histidine-containing phosphotransfer) domain-containing protein